MSHNSPNHFALDKEKAEEYLRTRPPVLLFGNKMVPINVWQNKNHSMRYNYDNPSWYVNSSAKDYERMLYSESERQDKTMDKEILKAGTALDIGCGMAHMILEKTLELDDPDICIAGIDDNLYDYNSPGGRGFIFPGHGGFQLAKCNWGQLDFAAPPRSVGLFWSLNAALYHVNDDHTLQNTINGIDHIAKPGAILRGNCRSQYGSMLQAALSMLTAKGWDAKHIETIISGVIVAQKPLV